LLAVSPDPQYTFIITADGVLFCNGITAVTSTRIPSTPGHQLPKYREPKFLKVTIARVYHTTHDLNEHT